ncbi:proline-rich acidic protein 1 [Ornithorhynchus anatinus]|uniref:proline-rich acidic protein 1 n=1 Tax=Ornithorhynchus anatinus TaxID=9258 RepID=UPI0010A78AB8|nr:proline-rich acidic protein 1 [Ornithorhynchus anatinus]
MKSRLIFFTAVFVLLLQGNHAVPKSKVWLKNGKDSSSDPNEPMDLSLKAVDPPEKDILTKAFYPEVKASRAHTGPKEDPFFHLRFQLDGPEEDKDQIHHSANEEDVILELEPLRALLHETLVGPEKDRDRFYHPEDD